MKDAFAAAGRASMNRMLPPQLFAGLLAIAADAVIAVDEEQKIIFFNEGAERIFGWTADEVGGQYLEILLPERFRANHRGHVRGFSAGHGRARLMGERQVISGLRKSGEEFPAEAAIQHVQLAGRSVFAAVLRDISARQRADDELRAAVVARDDMLGIVSHDLRNPANAVKMLAKSIIDHDRHEISDSVAERIAIIQQASIQIDMLIQDLLEVTRLEAGRLVIAPRDVDAATLGRNSADGLRPLATAGNLTLTVDVPDSLPMWGDPDRITQVLSNLIGNAIKFTPAGGSVTLLVKQREGWAEFSVTDSGEGIDPSELPFVFDRFFQSRQRNKRAVRHGAGLGLPIARGIVEAHGGQIWIESGSGTGTTVSFVIPVIPFTQ